MEILTCNGNTADPNEEEFPLVCVTTDDHFVALLHLVVDMHNDTCCGDRRPSIRALRKILASEERKWKEEKPNYPID